MSAAQRTRRRQLPGLAVLVLAVAAVGGCGEDEGPGSAADVSGEDGTGADGAAADGATADGATADGATAADANGGDGATTDTSTVACHPVKNTGCPAGEHCIYDGDTIRCEVDGAHDAGAACDDGKGCKVGICVKPQSGESRCAPFCTSDVQCASGLCNAMQSGKGKVCDMGGDQLISCNPLLQDCKEPGHACYSTPKGFGCLDAGQTAVAEPCAEDNTCAKGYACVGKTSGQPGLCRKICKIGGGEPSCESLTAPCSSLYGSATAGYCDG